MRYQKRPVVVEAVKWDGTTISERPDWVTSAVDDCTLFRSGDVVKVRTLEGTMIASPGDYIIRGVKGELYPCKPDIFEATYDAVVG